MSFHPSVEDLHLDSDKVESMYFANAHRLASEYGDGPRPVIMRFTSYEERELVLANAHKLAGSKRRILPDLPVVMKKERGRLAKEAYQIRKTEKLHTRIRDKGLEVYLEVRKEKTDSWVKLIQLTVQLIQLIELILNLSNSSNLHSNSANSSNLHSNLCNSSNLQYNLPNLSNSSST